MRHIGNSRRTRGWAACLALAACGSLLAMTGAPAGAAPEAVNGHFSLEVTSGQDCESPFGVCMTGSVSGRIKGTFSATVTDVIATNDTPATGALATTADAAVETKSGTIFCKLTGALQLNDDGPFVSLCVVNGGTEAWAGASGFLRTSGTFTLAEGGTGSYDGRVVAAAE